MELTVDALKAWPQSSSATAFTLRVCEHALHGELQLHPYTAKLCGSDINGDLVRLLLSKGLPALNRDQLFALLLDGAACRRVHLQLCLTYP